MGEDDIKGEVVIPTTDFIFFFEKAMSSWTDPVSVISTVKSSSWLTTSVLCFF